MTREERNDKLKHFIACLKCEVSGKCCNDNCSTQYDAGNMGEIIENLEAISKALEQEPKIIPIAVIKCEYDEDKLKELVDKAVLTVSQSDVTEVLDKIRAEIAELDIYYDNDYFSDNRDAMFKCNEILRVLDKYRGESENP